MSQQVESVARKYLAPNAAAQRLSALADLSSGEMQILTNLPRQTRSYVAREEIWNEGKVVVPRIILSGWACRQRTLGDGRRQIVSFLLPGDLCLPVERPVIPGACAVVALTAVLAADARALEAAVNGQSLIYPGLTQAVHLLAVHETLLLQDHVMRLGRQTAYERTVHLLLELRGRLNTVNLVTNNVFSLPLTQEVLADALGLSIVHVNRTLQQIRRDGMLEFRGGSVTILDLAMMESVSEFVPIAKDSEWRRGSTGPIGISGSGAA
jgi:CRP-like cAMP-binding protein